MIIQYNLFLNHRNMNKNAFLHNIYNKLIKKINNNNKINNTETIKNYHKYFSQY